MGYKIADNAIYLTRGDSLAATVTILTAEGEPYTPEAGEQVRFALKHAKMNVSYTDFSDQEPLILKQIPIDTLSLKLEPVDTKMLGFGEYKYDIEVTRLNGDVDTIIADADFELTPEVH